MSVRSVGTACLAGALATLPWIIRADGPVDILDAVGALPAHLAGRFIDPIAYARTSTGESIVLDRRRHTVFGIDRDQTRVRTIIAIGTESGRVLAPGVLSLADNDIFAVGDAPSGHERIQYFSLRGQFIGGFYLDSRVAPRLVLGSVVLSGVGSLHFTGRTFLVNRPDRGSLITELDNNGHVVKEIGVLRRTGHESDRDVHLALNLGLPLRDPAGGYFFVFQAGRPLLRKYDAAGAFVFERHIEGVELDQEIRTLPDAWPRRDDAGRLPVVSPLVRTAAVDPAGRIWISLIEPFTYVYDGRGDKVRTVQFRGASIIAAASLFFAGDRVLVTPGCYDFLAK
jgi:hypothetical protein